MSTSKSVVRAFLGGRTDSLERWVDALALGSILTLAIEVAFKNTPEWFAHQADLGQILYDLALAYLAAWIFNLLVVDIPKYRQLQHAYRATRQDLTRVSNQSTRLLTMLAQGRSSPSGPEEIDRDLADCVLASVDLYAEAPAATPRPDGSLLPIDWMTYLLQETHRMRRIDASLASTYAFLPAPLVAALRDAASARLHDFVELAASTKVANHSGSIFLNELVDYNEMCLRVKRESQELAARVGDAERQP